MTPENIINIFAEWSAKWSGEPFDQAYAQDYHTHSSILYNHHGEIALIEVRLGAFDHGAGVAYLAWANDILAVLYEMEATTVYNIDGFQSLPELYRPIPVTPWNKRRSE